MRCEYTKRNNNKYGNAMLICAIGVNLWLFLSIYKQLPRAWRFCIFKTKNISITKKKRKVSI